MKSTRFDAAILLVREDLMPHGRLFQSKAMRNDEGGVDLMLLDALQQRLQEPVYMSPSSVSGRC